MICTLSRLPSASRRHEADLIWALALGSLPCEVRTAAAHPRALRRRLARAEQARRERLGEIDRAGEMRA